jgi:hypothetical protein
MEKCSNLISQQSISYTRTSEHCKERSVCLCPKLHDHVHITASYFSKIDFNVIRLPIADLSRGLLSPEFVAKTLHIFLLFAFKFGYPTNLIVFDFLIQIL